MSKMSDEAFATAVNKGGKFLDKVERLEAEAAAMRAALEEIQEEAETDLDRDIILTACRSALTADAGRALLERLRQAEKGMMKLIEREKLFVFWVDQRASPKFPAYQVWTVGKWPTEEYMNFFAGETYDTEAASLTLDGEAEIAYADSISLAVDRFLEAHERLADEGKHGE